MSFDYRFRPLGIDIFCLNKKFLVYNMVSRNLKIKYRRSVLGVFWTLLSPIAMALTYYFVFKTVLNVQIPFYLAFILSGVLPWSFFAQTVNEGMESIVGNWGLVSKVPIPLQVFPYVGSLTNLTTLITAMPVLLAASLFSGAPVGASLLLVPVYLVCLFFMAYSLSMILALAYVFFRDLRHAMGIFIQLWFYATPVVYSEAMVPEQYRWVIFANPVGTLFAGMHDIFVHGAWPPATYVGATLAWTFALLIATLVIQNAFGQGVVEQI
jgi:ABC-type polysaccharide/polyol phosphate export permease